jgi:eukaryotic-like serine/threonine-protein kinase
MTPVDESAARSDPWLPPYKPGDIVAGKYRIERLLGNGGMGWVFQATHLMLQQSVALKVLRVDSSVESSEALERFRREGVAAASVSGEATARVMDVGALEDGSPYLVMECLEGRDLDSILDGRDRLPIDVAVNYSIQACEGLAETHAAGIIHRDLKPSNLFLAQMSDGSVRVKLLDFGISKFVEPSRDGGTVTSTGALIGSPVYMSPEQMRSSRCVDRRTDIWSMGVILYELLGQGRSPFSASTLPEICARVLDEKPAPLRSIRPDLPRSLEAIVFRCLAKDPSRRFQNAADLADALAPFGPPDARARAGRIRQILGKRMGASPPAPGPRQRRALHIGGVAAAVAAFSLVALLGFRPSTVEAAGLAATPPSHSFPRVVPEAVPISITQGEAVEGLNLPSVLPTAALSESATPQDTVAARESVTVTPKSFDPAPASPPLTPTTARVVARSDFDIPEFGGRE